MKLTFTITAMLLVSQTCIAAAPKKKKIEPVFNKIAAAAWWPPQKKMPATFNPSGELKYPRLIEEHERRVKEVKDIRKQMELANCPKSWFGDVYSSSWVTHTVRIYGYQIDSAMMDRDVLVVVDDEILEKYLWGSKEEREFYQKLVRRIHTYAKAMQKRRARLSRSRRR